MPSSKVCLLMIDIRKPSADSFESIIDLVFSAISISFQIFNEKINNTAKNTKDTLIKASFCWHGMKESNPRLLFWREICYHYTNPAKNPKTSFGFNWLFSFLVQSVLIATLTVLVHFQTLFQKLLIFTRKIINGLAFSALQLDHVILWHIPILITNSVIVTC